MKKILTVLSVFLTLCLLAGAQNKNSTPFSASFGLDERDAAAVRQIRSKMAQIRKTRPTVALVLSGGGAKGAATVGVLKYLEQYDFPIDMVVGTSVGGLLGGFYALGYDVDYLDTLIRHIDWDKSLSDKVDRKYVPYSRIRYKEKYLLSFPFYYKPEDYKNFLAGDMPFSPGRNRQIHLGAGEEDMSALARGSLLGSLPSGFVFGQNVQQIITSRTVGYSDSTDFFKFPTPFACVATDMASGRAKVWHSGSVNLALRSTMSIPGLFSPVRTEGMVLVDGGLRNNFPVNIAREMGADIVIGVDLSDASLSAEEIQNLADVLMSSMDLFSNDTFKMNRDWVDVHIHPDLRGYNMLSFNAAAIDTMYRRGYCAAQAAAPQLEALRRKLGKATFKRQAPSAIDISLQPVRISEIEIVGVSEKEAESVISKMRIREGDLVSRRDIEDEVATIFGKGSYDYVNYELRGTQDPYKLRILCKKGPMHQIGFGVRVDTQDFVSLLLNVGLNTHSMSGSSLDFTARISTNPYAEVAYAYNSSNNATYNVKADFRYNDRATFLTGMADYNISYLLTSQELSLSNVHWYEMDARLGLRNQVLKVARVFATDVVGGYDISLKAQDYPGVFMESRLETLDNGYFPTKGLSIGLRGDLIFKALAGQEGNLREMGIVAGDVLKPITWDRFTLLPQASFRMVFGDKIPILYSNLLGGGDFRGRYVEQQIPFVGLNQAAIRRDHIAVLRLDARLRLFRNHYVSAMSNVSFDFDDFSHIQEGEFVSGFGAGYAYNSIAGPLKAQVFWSTLTKALGIYFSFGYNF